MGVSKVTINGDTLIDITSDTVNQSNLLSGYSAHSANGEIVEGTLNIPTFNVQEKTVSPLTTTQSITPDQGFDGLSQVKVEAIPSTYINTSDATAVSGNVLIGKTFYARGNKITGTMPQGSVTVPATTIGAASSIVVDGGGKITAITNSSKSITPVVDAGYIASGTAGTVTVRGTSIFQLSTQASTTIVPLQTTQLAVGASKFTTGPIRIDAIPSTYVGSGIVQKTSSNLIVNGATVTAPSGYYNAAASAAVSTVGQGGIGYSFNENTGKFSAGVHQQEGYVAAGNRTTTYQLSTFPGSTITPTEEQQIIQTDKKYVLGNIAIDAIPSTYVGSAVPRFAERTIIPVEDAQTVATANKYMTGNIKISGIPTAYVGSAVPRQEGMSIIPTTSSQLAVGANKYTTGPITVEAIPNDYIIPAGTLSITTNGISDVTNYQKVDVSVENINNQNKTISPTESQQSITADTGYTGLGTVTVNAIPSTYVGSGIAQKTSSNLTVNGATVTAPAGYYANAATQSVTLGMAGAPVTTKGTVSNNTMTVSSSVSNTTGYIIGGTRSGTSVTVKASELVSGTKTITENGNAIDVTNYANVNVSVPSSDFVINLEQNQNGVFEPDCTYAEAVAAYNAGKTIIFSYNQNPVPGGYDADREWFTYSVYVQERDENDIETMSKLNHRWTSSGITQPATASYYDLNNQNKTVTPTESQQNITGDTGYTGLGTVTVNAIPTTYVGSGIARKSSSDLTVSGAKITAPAGYYANAATKSVASGTAGTPTATKGSVSNHSINVTPSVTNTTGYITGDTKTGTAVTVTAAELVSGTSTIYENGTVDVTNLASVNVSVYPKRTATITRTGMYDRRGNLISAVVYPDVNTVYYTQGDTFEFSPSSSLRFWVELYQTGNITISVDGVVIDSVTATQHNYYYVLPDKDIEIALDSSINKNNIEITTIESSSITVNPLSVTTSGTYTAPEGTAYSPVTVNISDSSELVYETGIWTPSTDIARGTITFAKTHTTRPFSIIVSDVTETAPTNGSMIYWAVSCWYDAFETPAYGSNLSEVYGGIRWAYATTSSYAANGTNIHSLTGESNLSCLEYVMSETGFYPYGNASNYYWRAGRTYKWVAVWAPTT